RLAQFLVQARMIVALDQRKVVMTAFRVQSESSSACRVPDSLFDATALEMILIHIAGLEKRYQTRSGETVNALTKVNLDIRKNEFISVVGPSGCGKTT